jgi:hypothetical protein
VNIPPDHALIIADGRATFVPLAELRRFTQGETPDTPIASITVPEHQLDEAVARVLDVLRKDEDEDVVE